MNFLMRGDLEGPPQQSVTAVSHAGDPKRYSQQIMSICVLLCKTCLRNPAQNTFLFKSATSHTIPYNTISRVVQDLSPSLPWSLSRPLPLALFSLTAASPLALPREADPPHVSLQIAALFSRALPAFPSAHNCRRLKPQPVLRQWVWAATLSKP